MCAFVSFRLGLTDGVSVVAQHWQTAMSELGFDTVTVAGAGPVDRTVAGLEIDAAHAPDREVLSAALGDADLVVVENLCTIPLNLPAARMVADLLAGRPAIMHHHDPPWQRERFAHVVELPRDDPAWRHVTINRLTQLELADRGFAATCIYNGFPLPSDAGDADTVRTALGVGSDELLFAHPVRAIGRKNVPAAIRLAEELDATYWLWGPPEEGYGAKLEELVGRASCRVVRGTPTGSISDLYAACDAVLFPSTWEGFGNPPIEAALHRRPAVVGDYPVADELRVLGFRWFEAADWSGLVRFLGAPDVALLDSNFEIAARAFSLDAMTRRIGVTLRDAGWLP